MSSRHAQNPPKKPAQCPSNWGTAYMEYLHKEKKNHMAQNVMVNTTLPSSIVFYFHESHFPVEQLRSISEEEKIAQLEGMPRLMGPKAPKENLSLPLRALKLTEAYSKHTKHSLWYTAYEQVHHECTLSEKVVTHRSNPREHRSQNKVS
jgi:hypothetical protein